MNRNIVNQPVKFTYNFEVTKKSNEPKEDFLIVGYASTPSLDRHGEIITEEALKSAAGSLLKKPNNILFLNHNYDRPIGVIIESKYVAGGLMIKARISKTEYNLREQIEEGLWGAFSIGGIVKDFEEIMSKDNDSVEGYKITNIELVEVSLVGVPANPEATLLEVISKSLKLNKEEKDVGGDKMKKKKTDEELELSEKKKSEDTIEDEEDTDTLKKKKVKEEKPKKDEDEDVEEDEEEEEEIEEEDIQEDEVEEDDNDDEDDDDEDSDDNDEDDEDDEEDSFDIKTEVKALHKKLDAVLEMAEDIKIIKQATISTKEEASDKLENTKKLQKNKSKRKGVLSNDKETEEEKLIKKMEGMSIKEIMEDKALWDILDDDMKMEIKNKYFKSILS